MSPPSRPDSPDLSDDALAERAQADDVEAFNALVVRYQRAVYGLCLRMLSSPAAAEDAAQEAFLSAWRGLPGYRGGSFQSWILRIAGNQCRDELRRRKRRPSDSLDRLIENDGDAAQPVAHDRSPEQHSLDSETGRIIQAGLAELPEDQRQAVILSDVQGLAYDEIAEVMETSIGTVKSRISRGRARLRQYLEARGELPGSRQRLGSEDDPAGTANAPDPDPPDPDAVESPARSHS